MQLAQGGFFYLQVYDKIKDKITNIDSQNVSFGFYEAKFHRNLLKLWIPFIKISQSC